MPNERVDKYVIMSPTLGPEETRIIYTWQEDSPEDVDLYVVAIKKDDDTICTVNYDNRQCPGITLDRDNADGGSNGPETVTFLSPEINQHYTHLVAIDDFEWVNNGQDFFASGSAIQVKNQLQQHDTTMMGTNGTASSAYYFFGCVVILPSGNFTFTDVPKGIFFNGDDNNSWISLKDQYCPH